MPSPVITRKLKRLAYEKFRKTLRRKQAVEDVVVEPSVEDVVVEPSVEDVVVEPSVEDVVVEPIMKKTTKRKKSKKVENN